MGIDSNGPKNLWDTHEPTKKPSWFKIATLSALVWLWGWEANKQDSTHTQETVWITQIVEKAKNETGKLLSEVNPFSPREAGATTLDENIEPKGTVTAKPPINRTAHLPAVYELLLKDKIPDAFTFIDQTNVELNTLVESAPLTISWISKWSPVTIVWGEYSINWWSWTTVPGTIKDKQTIKVRNTSSNNYATAENTTLTIGWTKWKSDTFTTTTLDIIPDYTPPTIDNLPSWGTGVASGSTTPNTVTMTDESAWWTSSNISITADNWGTISWYDANSYGVKTFNFIAPANPGPLPLDVTITYTITDATGNVTTETQVVSVAAEVAVDIIAPSKTWESFPNLDTQWFAFNWTMSFDENIAHVTSISISWWWNVQIDWWEWTSTISISWFAPYSPTTEITVTIEDVMGNSRTVTSNTYDLF